MPPKSLRGAKRRGNLFVITGNLRLLHPAMSGIRNDSMRIFQRSQMEEAA